MSRGDVAKSSITKSDMIEMLATEQPQLAYRDVELAVKGLLERMSEALERGERIEVRGFGSFSLPPRACRPQSEDRRGRAGSRQVRSAFQAGQGDARARGPFFRQPGLRQRDLGLR